MFSGVWSVIDNKWRQNLMRKEKSGDVIYAPILRKIISKNQSNCVFCSAYHIIQDIGAVTMVTAVVPVTSM